MSNGVVEGVAHGTGSCIGLCVVGPIVLVIGAIAIFWGIPRFSDAYSDASAGDKMVEAPRVLASFESAYLAASAEKGNNADITEKELNFKTPDDSKFFKYEYVTYPQGGIAGYKATALKNMGKFNEGHFLQTVYQKNGDRFTHCVGGNGADVDFVKELIPKFKATVVCSSVEIKKSSGSAQSAVSSNNNNSFIDSRDGKTYKKIVIGSQTWMGENLNYAAKGSVCYENKDANCAKYGRLYDWATAMGACPAGWRLPFDAEWETLTSFVGSSAGTKLKSMTGWNENGNGTDDYVFSAMPGGGGLSDGKFDGIGNYGVWWSATVDGINNARRRYMRYNIDYVGWNALEKSYRFSVRCVQEDNNTASTQSAASGGKIDNRLVGKWCDWGDGDGCFVFRANGTFSYIGYEYDNDADGTKYERIGRWSTVENKITMTFSNGDTTVETYSIKNTDDRGITGTILDFGSGRENYGKIAME